jgi:hypothetical protein
VVVSRSDDYSQRHTALNLCIERNTAQVPADGWFYVILDGEQVGRYRSLSAAQRAWQEVIEASGWQPPQREELSTEEKLRRDKEARDRSDYFEYWKSGRRHSW